MNSVFTKRNLIGGVLFLLLAGELNVGGQNGLFTTSGFVVLFALYFLYFITLESIVVRYKLNNISIVLVNFAFYSVLITGLFHGELADYVLKPDNSLITTLIRIQCSIYPLFAFYILRKIAPRIHSAVKVRTGLVMLAIYVALLSFSTSFGLVRLLSTFQSVPLIAVGFTIAAVMALLFSVRQHKKSPSYYNNIFGWLALILLIASLVPGLLAFLLLIILMIITGVMYLWKPKFRNSSVL